MTCSSVVCLILFVICKESAAKPSRTSGWPLGSMGRTEFLFLLYSAKSFGSFKISVTYTLYINGNDLK